ncbi:AbrB/MazE/SpoVT family DNA-binding domain-containing protein [Streptacidiphilus neutrinimicus]|uniref:AbrB/MazE/SpoVT family DNA-binding domain-containing protein n=1 Tax=Streptacidiphilus neutrinimicus TaxID=105420 RepID=UPI0005A7DFB4|nr:AbrB/MazE/SpoVT family DNA-binding domain-containing protein [Streptacidiphilus neutrinimicus]
MIRTPSELVIDEHGRVALPLGLLAEAGLNPGDRVLAFSNGDGRLELRRFSDAVRDLLEQGTL